MRHARAGGLLAKSTAIVLFLGFLFGAAPVCAADAPTAAFIFYDAKGNKLKSARVYDYNATKGESITIEFDCKVATLKIEETERQLRIYEDIQALVKKLIDSTADTTCTGNRKETYVLKYERATIKVQALDLDGTEIAVTTLITGPKEHLSLGVDLPVNSRKSLKYDSTSKSLVPQDTNPQLYISVNYLLGDVLEKPEHLKWHERFDFKAMILASRRPLDSFGLGIGYKLGGIKLLGVVDLKGVSVFGGYFVTKSDTVSDGTPQLNQGRTRTWHGGVSYDLGTGLGWVKF